MPTSKASTQEEEGGSLSKKLEDKTQRGSNGTSSRGTRRSSSSRIPHLEVTQLDSNGSTTHLSSSPSPMWGEAGRKLPSVTSMLSLPHLSLSSEVVDDIEDIGKKDRSQKEDLLLQEIQHSTPRVSLEWNLKSPVNSLCEKCKRPGK